jgi:hypothetical protein
MKPSASHTVATHPNSGEGHPPRHGEATRWRRAVEPGRWALIVVVAVGLTAYVLLSSLSSIGRTCKVEVDSPFGLPSKTCDPVTITDPAVLIPLALLILLLAPNFSKLAVPGLFTLEREVDAQGQRLQALETTVNMRQTIVIRNELAQAAHRVPQEADHLSERLEAEGIAPDPQEVQAARQAAERQQQQIAEALERVRRRMDDLMRGQPPEEGEPPTP